MTGIWSTIKAAAPALSHQHETASSRAADTGSNLRSSSPPRILGTPPSSRSLPRPPSSLDARGNPRGHTSTASPPSHSRSSGTRSPTRLSRNSTSTALKEKGQGKDKDTEAENADRAVDTTATLAAASGDNTSDVNVEVARPTPPPAHTPGANSAIDPLSQHIFMRKNTEPSIPQRLTQMAEGIARASSELSRNVVPANEVPKDKSSKKGSSFLSRLSIRGGRKKELGDLDSDSELGSEVRMDGINARVFSQTLGGPVTGGGYVPHHKEPPRYIRTRATNKRTREFNRMFLAQELVGTCPPEKDGDSSAEASGRAPVVTVSVAGAGDRKTTRTGGAIWATEFSKDGRYLATAGRDHVVRIWAVLSTPEERRSHEEDEAGGAGERLSAPVFRDQPVKEFRGHTGEVLDLSWSKNNFLLSSSMDKTVRLWHMSRSECLCTFKHKDFVTRLAFHPRDDRFFLAGSLDTMLRLWSIPDQAVAFSAQLPDLVTAVAFSPDGKVAIAGLLNGLCMFYETEGLKLSSQIHVRSSRGKNAKGSKITGIQTMVIPPPRALDTLLSQAPGSATASVASTEVASSGEVRVLITSNDSRIRIYSLRDKSLDVKLKGHENLCSQIAATFSDDGKYVICGSEDRKAFLWSLTGSDALVQDKDKSPCEYFEAHGDIVTTALFAPTKTRMLLGQSGDPIYDLCNPPPVVLQSLEEAATNAAASQTALTHDSSLNYTTGAPPSEPAVSVCKKPEPSPAYIARSTHYDGNIIVTTGDTGIIKVFRQDCAFAKRRHDSWETGSTFSRKLAAHGSGYVAGGGLGRSASILTRTSAGSTAHSRRGSLSQPVAPGVGLGGAGGATGSPAGAGAAAHSDHRILSWRQGIVENGVVDRRSVLIANGGGGTPARSERSLSPTKASRTSLNSAYNLASEARKLPYAGAAGGGGVPSSPGRGRMGATGTGSALTSPTASVFSSHTTSGAAAAAAREGSPAAARLVRVPGRERRNSTRKDEQQQQQQQEPSVPPTPGFILRSANEPPSTDPTPPADATAPSGGNSGSSSFWNLGRWRGITGFRAASSSSQGPTTTTAGARARSSGSRPSLSKTRGVTDGEGDERGAEVDVSDKDKDKDKGAERVSASRRQSLGVLPVKPSGGGNNNATTGGDGKAVGDRRASLPAAAALLQDRSDSDAYSVPVNSGVGEEDGQTPLEEVGRGQGDVARNRRADWSRGHSHVSRLNAEMGP